MIIPQQNRNLERESAGKVTDGADTGNILQHTAEDAAERGAGLGDAAEEALDATSGAEERRYRAQEAAKEARDIA